MERKYKPEKLKDFLVPSEVVAQARKWIKTKETRKKPLFISGEIGSGKTTFSSLLSDESKFIHHIVTTLDLKNGKNTESRKAKNNLQYLKDDILCNFDVYSGKRKLLIIDDIDSIINMDKGFMSDLFRLIKDNAEGLCGPIIITSAISSSKKINELKRKCVCIHLPPPTPLSMKRFIGQILRTEGMSFESVKGRDELVDKCKGDFRRLYFILDYFKTLKHSDGKIHLQDIDSALETFQKRKIDHGIFELTEKIMKEPLSYEELENYYDCDKSLLPLMIHENYLNFAEDIEDCRNISDSFSQGDVVDNMIYSHQTWELFHIHGLLSTIVPVFNLPYDPKKYDKVPIVFTKILTKSSSQAARTKELNIVKDAMKGKGISVDPESFSMMFSVMMNNIGRMVKRVNTNEETRDEHIQEIADYLESFGLTNEHIDSINKLSVVGRKEYTDISSIKKELKVIFKRKEEKQLEEKKQKYSIRLEKEWEPAINMTLKL